MHAMVVVYTITVTVIIARGCKVPYFPYSLAESFHESGVSWKTPPFLPIAGPLHSLILTEVT